MENSEELLDRLNEFLDDSPERIQKEKAAAKLVEENRGATDRILKTLEEIVRHP